MPGATEQKIKNAAKTLFLKNGFANTSVRDIALAANINVALMNYYFRSKEKLFEIIMIEFVAEFFQNMKMTMNEEKLTVQQKIERFAEAYISLLITQPDLPFFILGEMRNRPESFIKKMGIDGLLSKMLLIKQIGEARKEKSPVNPAQFFMSLMGMTVFPFIGRPLIQAAGGLTQDQFNMLMEERKKLIPQWFNMIIQMK